MNPDPEYILDKEYLNGPVVAHYRREVDQLFGCNLGGVPFYNGLALAIIDNDEITVQEQKEDEENQPTGPLFVSEDGGATYVATGQEIPPYKLVETTIDGRIYLTSYTDGYKAGRKYFEDFYQPNASIIYGPELKSYTENLHNLYKHKDFGWLWHAKAGYGRINHNTFWWYGYYAGLCHSVDLLLDKYPQLTKDIKVCRTSHTNLSDQQSDLYSISTLSDSEKINYVISILAPLGGVNPQKNLIMSREDFESLITYTKYLALADSVPAKVKPILITQISNEHIRYTFYKLHKALFGKGKIHASFIDFLHAVFKQFSGTALTTTKAKFSVRPSSYDSDFTG